MRIFSIMLAGTGLALGLVTPSIARDVAPTGTLMGKSFGGSRPVVGSHRPGMIVQQRRARFHSRWFAGWYAPGGWASYRRPVVGYVLPPYWISPAYRIGDYGAYGLPAPADGYGWSRYYDDAVMTDRHGRVKEHRSGVDWRDHEDDGPPPAYDDDVTASDAPPPPPYEYDGRWTGTWRDDKGHIYSGEYEGRFEGDVRADRGVDYDAPPYAAMPPVVHHNGPGEPVVTTTQAPGYFAGGYYYPGAMTTTVVLQPAVTTTRNYVTEVAHRHGSRRKARCNCN